MLDDPQRLESIRWYEQTGGFGETLDRYARLAAHAVEAPIAFFSVVDTEHESVRAAFGLGGEIDRHRSIPISDSLCRIVVDTNRPMVVDDLDVDQDLRDHPGRRLLNVGAYAGVPIRDPEGHILGSICAIDCVPRPWDAGQVELITDVAASLESELSLHRRGAQLESKLETERREHELEQILAKIATAANREAGLEATARALVEHGSSLMDASFVSLAVVDGGRIKYFHDPKVDGLLTEPWRSEALDAPVPMVRAAVDLEPVVIAHADRFQAWPELEPSIDELGIQSFAALPLGIKDIDMRASLGIGFAHALAGGQLPETTWRMVNLTNQALLRAYRFDWAREQAQTLRKMAIPSTLPTIDGLDIAGAFLAPNHLHRVGGDIYDVVQRDDGSVVFMIADAVGHDVDATSAATRVRHAIGALTMEGLSPAATLNSVNRYLTHQPQNRLVTCACIELSADLSSGLVATAGHPQPRLVATDHVTQLGKLGDPLLGLGDHRYEEHAFRLEPDEALVLFTDGLIEHRDRPLGVGEPALDEMLSRVGSHRGGLPAPSADGIIGSLIDELYDATGGEDMAVMSVVRRPGRPGSPVDSSSDPSSVKANSHNELSLSWPAEAVPLAEARRHISQWLRHRDLVDLEPSTVLIATELLTNAREHSVDGGEVGLHLVCVEEGLRIAVSNTGPVFTVPEPESDVTARGGRGLAIVSRSADSMSIESHGGIVTVVAQLGLG